MKVSVIVPVYNVESYLDKCLTSLVKQTLQEIEIIVVNDGSKDNSEKIIKKYLKEFKNLMREKFPNWSKNVYFKKKSYKFKIICLLAYYRQRKLIYFLNKRR